jgi:hypothetical protein
VLVEEEKRKISRDERKKQKLQKRKKKGDEKSKVEVFSCPFFLYSKKISEQLQPLNAVSPVLTSDGVVWSPFIPTFPRHEQQILPH